jgi:ATP phosphoribosyltransferase
VVIAKRSGFSKCRLSLAIRKQWITGVEFFNGKKIATSYPAILPKVFKRKKHRADIHVITDRLKLPRESGWPMPFSNCKLGIHPHQQPLKEVEVVIHSKLFDCQIPTYRPKKRRSSTSLFSGWNRYRGGWEKIYLTKFAQRKNREIAALLRYEKSDVVPWPKKAGVRCTRLLKKTISGK